MIARHPTIQTLLAAAAKHEQASIVTIDSAFKGLKDEIEVKVLSSIADLL